jgi:hypothetical protein
VSGSSTQTVQRSVSVSDKFFNPIEVPVILDVPVPEPGFSRIYGRGDDVYALFGDGTEKLLTGGVVVVGASDRDVTFPEEIYVMEDRLVISLDWADSAATSDKLIVGPLLTRDTVGTDDSAFVTLLGADYVETVGMNTAANVVLTAETTDTAALSDTVDISVVLVDTGSVTSQRQTAELDAIVSADTVEANNNFTSPNNLTDQSDSSGAELRAAQTALSGSVTVSGSIEVSLPDLGFTPSPDIVSTELQWGWTTTSTGTLQSGNSVSSVIAYSLDNGSSYTTLETVTNNASTGNQSLVITATFTQIQQLRFRATATVVSGTALGVNATQTFNFRYARADVSLTQTL